MRSQLVWFLPVLARNRVSILAILILNRVWFFFTCCVFNNKQTPHNRKTIWRNTVTAVHLFAAYFYKKTSWDSRNRGWKYTLLTVLPVFTEKHYPRKPKICSRNRESFDKSVVQEFRILLLSTVCHVNWTSVYDIRQSTSLPEHILHGEDHHKALIVATQLMPMNFCCSVGARVWKKMILVSESRVCESHVLSTYPPTPSFVIVKLNIPQLSAGLFFVRALDIFMENTRSLDVEGGAYKPIQTP